MRNQGLGSWTARRARKTPQRVALVLDGHEQTYQQLHERAVRLAHALRGLGVRRDDRVAYLGPNHPAFLETLFATGMAAAVFVPLNPRLARPELAYTLADSGSRVLVYAPGQAAVATGAAGDAAVAHLVALDGPAGGQAGYEELLAGQPTEPIDEPVGLDDPCLLLYTSGTTGRPKGALLSHGNITWNCINTVVDVDLAGDEVTLLCAPLFHAAGLGMTCLPTLLKGGTVVLAAQFDPERVLALVEARRVTYLFGVPTMYQAIASSPRWQQADLSSLRTLTCGGAPIPEAIIRTYLERGLTFIQGYGMTEAGPGATILDRSQVLAKAGSAGVPHFFTDVRVMRPDLTEAAAGEKGEVLVQGPNVMERYWGAPGGGGALADGWFRSGDVAVADEDGYVFIVDRVKDLIISGGENIYPAEVENALYDHPAIAECAVIGVPDERWGEVGRAVVVLKPGQQATEQAILESLNDRLARYKIPRSVRFAEELPRSATGKILRKRLRESYGGAS